MTKYELMDFLLSEYNKRHGVNFDVNPDDLQKWKEWGIIKFKTST